MNFSKHDPSRTQAATADQVTHLILTVFRAHGALLEWGDRLVEPLGITSARWQMLGALALAGKAISAPHIGAAMGVTRQGAQKQLNLLLELGLVQTQANPGHRRSPLYTLTPQGRQLYLEAEALWTAQAAHMAALMSSAQAEHAAATLDTILSHLPETSPPPKELP